MKISFSPQAVFLRNQNNGFVFNIRQYLLGEIAQSNTSIKTKTTKKKQPVLINLTIILLYSRAFQWFLNLVISSVLVIAFAWFTPKIFYSFFPAPTIPLQTEQIGSPLGGDFELGVSATEVEKDEESNQLTRNYPLPPKQDFLPEGDWLIIPRIGVRSQLRPTENYQDALNSGLWLVPDFSPPGNFELPMIVAGHRYGWQWWWKDDYWKYNSFYLLPDLKPGDFVEVISDQRKWVYEIYSGEEGTQISDYQADLILYTCKHLSGPLRIFRYARLINLDNDSQS